VEARTNAALRPDVLRLRKRSARAVQLILAAINEDSQLSADPELAAEFRRKFSDMGARIALFQAKWPAALLSDDDDQFIADRKRLREEDAPVTEWALRMLK